MPKRRIGLPLFVYTASVLSLLAVARAVKPPIPAVVAPQGVGALDFNRDIEPILADNCYACHGPDPGGRKAKLRLDRPDGALAKRKDDTVPIVPGKPSESEVIRRIESSDPDDRMPPAPRERLTAEQVATLKAWVAQGAKYRDHWSFERLVKPAVPELPGRDGKWVKNPIDAFVVDRLCKEGLEPSAEATRRELIRRVTLDLTGLLPTPAEVASWTLVASQILTTDKALNK